MREKVLIVLIAFSLLSFPCLGQNIEEDNFYIAQKAFSDGFYDAAFTLFKKFIDTYPKSTKKDLAQLYIAKCFYFQKEYVKSLAILTLLAGKNLEFADEVYYWLAQIYLEGKDYKESGKYARKLLVNFPSSKFYWWANYVLANTQLKESRYAEARQLFEEIIAKSKIVELEEKSFLGLLDVFHTKKDYARIKTITSQYISQHPHGPLIAKMYFARGESYYATSLYSRAIADYNEALRYTSADLLRNLIYQSLGWCFLEKGDQRQAKTYFGQITDQELRQLSYGIYYARVKEYQKAVDELNAFLDKFPESKQVVKVYLTKADSLYELGRINDALYLYKKILNIFPAGQYGDIIDKAHYGLAWCYLRNGEFKGAIDEFENTLEHSDNPIVKISSQVQIADVYQETDRFDEALSIYSQVVQDYPDNLYADYIQFQIGAVYLRKGEADKALLAFRNLKRNFPHSRLVPQAQYYLSVAYFSQGDYVTTKQLIKEFIDTFPESELRSEAYYLYGKCFFNEKDFGKAIEVFSYLVKTSPEKELTELASLDIADAYLNMQKFAKAKEAWRQFIKKFPTSTHIPSVLLSLGGIHEKENDFDQAQRYYEMVVDKHSSSSLYAEALVSLGHLWWQQGDYKKAHGYFSQVISQDIKLSPKAKLFLAQVYTDEGRSDEALSLYRELAEEGNETSTVALLKRAYLLKDLKRYQEAIEGFRAVIERGVESARLHFSLGFCLDKLKHLDDALEEYFAVVYMFDDVDYKVKAYFRIARIYERKHNKKEAKKIYREIIALGIEESKVAQERLKALGD